MKHRLFFLFLLWIGLSTAGFSQYYASDDTSYIYTMHGTVYANMFEGRKTSSGEIFTQSKYTAAHWKLKLGTLVRVTCIETGQQVIVKINDRCPKRGVIDLTRKAATAIGIKGTRKVTVQVLPESYRSIWEQQDVEPNTPQSAKPAAQSEVQSDKPKASQNTTNTPKTEKPKPTEINKPQTSKSSTSAKPSDPTFYILDLGIASSRAEAQKLIETLPIYYQDKVELVPSSNSSKIKMRLNMFCKYKQIVEVKESLASFFPNSVIKEANISPK